MVHKLYERTGRTWCGKEVTDDVIISTRWKRVTCEGCLAFRYTKYEIKRTPVLDKPNMHKLRAYFKDRK